MRTIVSVNFCDGDYVSLASDGIKYYLYSCGGFIDEFEDEAIAKVSFYDLADELMQEKLGLNDNFRFVGI